MAFISCRLKLERASEHLDVLENETKAWIDSKPYSTPKKRNADGSRH